MNNPKGMSALITHTLTARESCQTDEIPHHLLPYKHMIIRASSPLILCLDLVIARFFLRDQFLEKNKFFRWRDHLHGWLERILARVSIITLNPLRKQSKIKTALLTRATREGGTQWLAARNTSWESQNYKGQKRPGSRVKPHKKAWRIILQIPPLLVKR